MRKWKWEKIFACSLTLVLCITAANLFRLSRITEDTIAPVRFSGSQLVLDAGHGGEDGGAVSRTGVPESRINLAIVQKLNQLMGFYGVAPVLLRNSDVSLHDSSASTLREKKVSDLHNRVAIIEATENAVVISIHQNTFPDPAYHGAQVFFRSGEDSRSLAIQIQDSLRALDPSNKRIPAKIPDSVYLMKHITCQAVLVECGFLSNAAEDERLQNTGYQTQLALCIAGAWLRSGEAGAGDTPSTAG
ncbi:MAG: N-acetylmuramoyl-L-alanine amidase [Pseudoflavonifractor sp.]|nr:N-acetylmuramoyl-L-alanine amidase [Pseudoflavonifractor sp.]